MNDNAAATQATAEARNKTITTVVYALQAFAFLNGVTMIVGVIINYVKREDVANTWLESHFRWQIRTFWWFLAWCILGGVTVFVGIGFVILAADAIWLIYRIVKGWLRLVDGKTMYPK